MGAFTQQQPAHSEGLDARLNHALIHPSVAVSPTASHHRHTTALEQYLGNMPPPWSFPGDRVEGVLANWMLALLSARDPEKLKKLEAELKAKFPDMPFITKSEG